MASEKMSDKEAIDLAEYIVEWLEFRNGGEFGGPLTEQKVGDRRQMIGELKMILQHGGKPPNWVR